MALLKDDREMVFCSEDRNLMAGLVSDSIRVSASSVMPSVHSQWMG